jgi:hypothetical protein
MIIISWRPTTAAFLDQPVTIFTEASTHAIVVRCIGTALPSCDSLYGFEEVVTKENQLPNNHAVTPSSTQSHDHRESYSSSDSSSSGSKPYRLKRVATRLRRSLTHISEQFEDPCPDALSRSSSRSGSRRASLSLSGISDRESFSARPTLSAERCVHAAGRLSDAKNTRSASSSRAFSTTPKKRSHENSRRLSYPNAPEQSPASKSGRLDSLSRQDKLGNVSSAHLQSPASPRSVFGRTLRSGSTDRRRESSLHKPRIPRADERDRVNARSLPLCSRSPSLSQSPSRKSMASSQHHICGPSPSRCSQGSLRLAASLPVRESWTSSLRSSAHQPHTATPKRSESSDAFAIYHTECAAI